MRHFNKSKTCLFQRSLHKERKQCRNWRNYYLLVQDEYNERASIRTFNKFWIDESVVRQSEVLNSKLSRFCEEGSEHRNLSLSWEVQLSHSAVEIRRNLQRPVLRSSLIPERMELGIYYFRWSKFLRGGNPKRSCSIKVKSWNWSEVKLKNVFTKTTRSMVMLSCSVLLN